MTNLPQRSCVICRAQKNKNELLRIVKNKDKRIEKSLETPISEEIYSQIENIIKKQSGGDVIG